MVICGYLIDESNIEKLRSMGVKDSKLLTPEQRKRLSRRLKRVSDSYKLIKVSAADIDKLRIKTNLNKIEIFNMQNIINTMKPDKVVIDACERNTKRFGSKIKQGLKNKKIDIISENFADKNYPEVSAASILAKLHRDRAIEKLHKKHGFFGSGYPSDERTIKFLNSWIKRNKEFPDFVRRSWTTTMLMKEEKEQKKIKDFG